MLPQFFPDMDPIQDEKTNKGIFNLADAFKQGRQCDTSQNGKSNSNPQGIQITAHLTIVWSIEWWQQETKESRKTSQCLGRSILFNHFQQLCQWNRGLDNAPCWFLDRPK